MKKIFNRVTTYICVLLLVCSLSGCSLILDVETPTDYNYETITVDVNLSQQLIFCDTYNNEGTAETSNVTFNTNGVTEDYENFEDVAATVNRSVVKIIMKDSSGNHLSYGSGVIVDIEGGLDFGEYYVLTCHHVISNGGNISICVPDNNGRNHGDIDYDERYTFNGYIGGQKVFNPFNVQEVSLVGGDRDSDVALLKLNTSNRLSSVSIQKATFPEASDELKYAQEVFSIGNPTGQLPMTFLSGNISYIDRIVVLDSIGYMELIQHDCLITHGNSGGGLFNMKGQLIGITNAGSDEYKGMNYAIPYYGVDGFMAIAEQLIENSTTTNYGYVEGRWNLGITITETNDSVEGSSVRILSVETSSNADGLLEKDDYILKVEFGGYSEKVTSENTFKSAIFLARESLTDEDSMKITVAREVVEDDLT